MLSLQSTNKYLDIDGFVVHIRSCIPVGEARKDHVHAVDSRCRDLELLHPASPSPQPQPQARSRLVSGGRESLSLGPDDAADGNDVVLQQCLHM